MCARTCSRLLQAAYQHPIWVEPKLAWQTERKTSGAISPPGIAFNTIAFHLSCRFWLTLLCLHSSHPSLISNPPKAALISWCEPSSPEQAIYELHKPTDEEILSDSLSDSLTWWFFILSFQIKLVIIFSYANGKKNSVFPFFLSQERCSELIYVSRSLDFSESLILAYNFFAILWTILIFYVTITNNVCNYFLVAGRPKPKHENLKGNRQLSWKKCDSLDCITEKSVFLRFSKLFFYCALII